MNGFRERKTWIVFIAVLLLFAACKGETPTAPPTGGGSPPGTNPPPTGVSVALAVSSASPLIDTTVTITATVTENGQPVPNGTAVEFNSTGGSLDGGGTSIIKTTTNGVATVTLTSSAANPIRVTATVNNVTRQVDVNFLARPITPVPPNTSPTIVSVTPSTGRPTGGETIRITGTNFRGPVKVFFRLPNQTNAVEASIVNATETTIDVITPGVNLGVGQELQASIIVITQAGTTSENRVERTNAFTFRAERLTPVVFSVTPNSGPVTGNTRVTLIGEGFQEPVQVLFDTAEAKVVKVEFNQIIVETPPASKTPPTGSGAVTGAVNVTVRNLTSQTSNTLTAGFNYKSAMVITAVSPGGTTAGVAGARVTIDGDGFVPPVVVVVRTPEGDIGLQPISVTGTRIIAIAPAVFPDTCDDVIGDLIVTNIVNGDQAEGPPFTFFVPNPVVINVNPFTVTAGGNVTVTVGNALPGPARITLGTRTVFPTAATFDETTRTATFQIAVPLDFAFPTEACTVDGIAGTRRTGIRVNVGYENVATSCEDEATEALTINPVDTTCAVPPPPNAVITPAVGTCGNMGNVTAAGVVTGTATFTITNTGGRPLIVSSVAVVGSTNTTTVTAAPTSATIAPQSSQTFTVTADPAAAGAFSGTVRANTNDPDTPALDFCFTGNGT
jgi:hypothetical protein